jgi:alkaline phosphatase D
MKKIILLIACIAFLAQAASAQVLNFKDNTTLMPTGKVVHEDLVLSENLEDFFDPKLKPFYHGVASGDPTESAVIIWTRIHPEMPGDYTVAWRVATDVELKNVVKSGDFITNGDRDYTVKVDVTGLVANTVYYYGFTHDNINSLTGRTRTLPTGDVDRVRFALVTGTNFNWGYFNGYKRIAERNDLFAIIHTGDYFYEYQKGHYVQPNLEGRDAYPIEKCISVDDYRGRFSQYRLDPDLRRAHQQLPMLSIWDDHESSNDSWVGGAEDHDPDVDGPWETRRDNSVQVYYEWMPLRQNDPTDAKKIYRKFSFGNLVDIMMTESRLAGRDQQLAPKGEGSTVIPVMEWLNPARTLLGVDQYNWLTQNVVTSKAEWKIVTSSTMMMQLFGFGYPIEGFGDDPMGNQDSWDGYPVERAKLLGAVMQNNVQNFGVLSGDFHTAFVSYLTVNPHNLPINPVNPQEPNPWPAFDAETGNGSIGFEITTPSVTTANLNEQQTFAGLPVWGLKERDVVTQQIEGMVLGGNPHMVYTNTDQHGYVIVDFSKEKVQADYWYTVNTVNEKPGDSLYKSFPNLIRVDTEAAFGGFYVENGKKKINYTETPMADMPNAPAATPFDPPLNTSVEDSNPYALVYYNFPNPANEKTTFHYVVAKPQNIKIKVYDINGNQVGLALDSIQEIGVYGVEYNCSDLQNGTYFYVIETETGKITRKFVVSR